MRLTNRRAVHHELRRSESRIMGVSISGGKGSASQTLPKSPSYPVEIFSCVSVPLPSIALRISDARAIMSPQLMSDHTTAGLDVSTRG